VRKIQRLAAVGAMAALTVALGACSSSETPSTSAPASSSAAAAPTMEAAAGDGVTEISDIFGPACSQVPTEGEGSAQGMVDDPVATAASNNPLLKTLTAAVGAAGLGDTLNAAPAITVYAPFDGAFANVQAALGDEAFNALLANPQGLGAILQYHVVGSRMNAEQLVAAGTTTQLAGGTVTVGGTADAPTFTGAGNTGPATTLCGNIPTANATVFVIDTVLMPKS
jgi:uncharacterized surface protein with fasciclin (FAS1) repeats